MKIRTQSTVTITMSGVEAQQLAIWLYNAGALGDNGVAHDLWDQLKELPDEVDAR